MKAGDRVNLECDMIGKYVVRAAELAGLTLTPARAGDVRH
jgi:riboflavin synthase alpha subunit